MSKRENNMSESGWTRYLDDSSWTCKNDTTHFQMENIGGKEGSENTKRVEHIDSSMASDASSGPILHQRGLSSHKLDPSPYPISCPTASTRLQQDLEPKGPCSRRHKKPRKKRKMRRVENNKTEWLQDTATTSRRGSTVVDDIKLFLQRGTVQIKANLEKGALEQMTTEWQHDSKSCMEEGVGFCHENNINSWEQRMEINNHGVEGTSPNKQRRLNLR